LEVGCKFGGNGAIWRGKGRDIAFWGGRENGGRPGVPESRKRRQGKLKLFIALARLLAETARKS